MLLQCISSKGQFEDLNISTTSSISSRVDIPVDTKVLFFSFAIFLIKGLLPSIGEATLLKDKLYPAKKSWDSKSQAEADHKYHSKPLAVALNERENRPWGDWNYGKGLTANTVAKRLSGFGIKPKKVRRKDNNLQGYELSAFEDAIKRYPLPPSETEQSEQPNKDGDKPATSKRNNSKHVPATKSTETSHTYSTVPGVPGGVQGGTKKPRTFMSRQDVPNERA